MSERQQGDVREPTPQPTPQEKMRAGPLSSGIPNREVLVFGSSVIVTCIDEKSRDRWKNLLGYVCRGVRAGQGLDYKEGDNGRYLRCNQIRVWRIGGRIDPENPDRKLLKHGERTCLIGPRSEEVKI